MPDTSSPNALDTLSVEERMRRALGLTGERSGRSSPPQAERLQAGSPGRSAGRSSADKPRHRFVQDGTVPVTILNRHRPDEADGLSASHAAIEAALQDERTARAEAERSLQKALATVHDLQTKLGHAELAHREATAAAQTARAEADALRAEHQEQALRWSQDLGAGRAAHAATKAAPAVEPVVKAQEAASALAPRVAAKRTRKTAEPRQRELQPVKWWLKSARKRWP